MIKVKSIKKSVLVSGLYMGYPCTLIRLLNNGKKTEINDVIEVVRENDLKVVVISGCINDNPEIRPLTVGLCSIWYTVIISTDASDDIEALRSIKGCNFIVNVVPPTEKANNVNMRMLQYFNVGDELLFNLTDANVYASALIFLKAIMITKPTISFSVKEGSALRDMVKADSAKFNFKCRILPLIDAE